MSITFDPIHEAEFDAGDVGLVVVQVTAAPAAVDQSLHDISGGAYAKDHGKYILLNVNWSVIEVGYQK